MNDIHEKVVNLVNLLYLKKLAKGDPEKYSKK
jgi:hypothetical protein